MDETTNGQVTAENDLTARILLGYEEARRRDTLVEREKLHWKIGAFLGWAMAAMALGVAVWLFVTRATLEAFVQVVQVDDAGTVVPMGVPAKLLDYTPQEGQWLDLIGEWITAVRWRGSDVTLTQSRLAWAYQHTCGDARRLLQYVEEKEQLLKPNKRRVTVQLQSITKTPSPLSYQALWEEVVLDQTQKATTERWTGTFTTGRMRPKDMQSVLVNRLGLCLSAFDVTRQPEGK